MVAFHFNTLIGALGDKIVTFLQKFCIFVLYENIFLEYKKFSNIISQPDVEDIDILAML